MAEKNGTWWKVSLTAFLTIVIAGAGGWIGASQKIQDVRTYHDVDMRTHELRDRERAEGVKDALFQLQRSVDKVAVDIEYIKQKQ